MKGHEEGLKNKLGEPLLTDGEVLDLVYEYASRNDPDLLQFLRDNEEEET